MSPRNMLLKIRNGSRDIIPSMLKLGTRWGWVLTPRPGLFAPGKYVVPIFTGGWVGPKAGLDDCGKSRPPLRYPARWNSERLIITIYYRIISGEKNLLTHRRSYFFFSSSLWT